jgi:hypothetical protein
MKVTLEFENQENAINAIQGTDWKFIVGNLDEKLRCNIKHSDKDEPELQEIRDYLHELLNDYNLILE